MQIENLVEAALQARQRAYAPYSRFRVGAALLASNGQIFPGCNVENASFGVVVCAERTAGVTAIAAGVRDWQAIAVVLSGGGTPCGICRQFLCEFASQLTIITADADLPGHPRRLYGLEALLPESFSARDVLGKPTDSEGSA